uniref:Sulfotransferase n=1 Tax=Dunaliella tertiolecta TaxID=3047 RepID=A0A7S3VN12_DUNTE|mmetsp:Transcript_15925/g.43313  ORF Transcript_15925/g.43313 Transcript_15925/m.43313 type:complete len:272 (+) Transcript_15925:648-1463(+)|eukprot:CAMPEP_0202337448 /NCGR_PEP_ID=MMETSP1126-20121109/122_1 /ASSEMBLY_ACC=CAM_ASM_000457 /TAXON_ID=3047 /ORGANISM="Dunaliella tertiolecta, Strain CCMP1320" /LENGTH=271 /DNA_ID=CAMNT_0048927633 /DNA_START=538 /DNA_END=1353 /DNA_ORIENTATION=+
MAILTTFLTLLPIVHSTSSATSYATSQLFIYHMHIDKTGGSTLKTQHSHFFPGFTSCNRVLHVRSYGSKDIARVYEEVQKAADDASCNIFSYEAGHTVASTIGRRLHPSRKLLILTFLRNPVMQYLSRVQHDISAGRFSSANEFYNAQHYFNRQSSFFNFENGTGLSLPSITFLGITESFRLSMCLFAFTLYDHIDFVMKKSCGCEVNVSNRNVRRLNMTDVRNYVPYSLIQQIQQTQRRDYALYMQAIHIFLNRVQFMEKSLNRSFECLY